VNPCDDLYEYVALAKAGNQAIAAILAQAARMVAKACTPVVDMLEPQALILSGPIFDAPQVVKVIKEYLDTHSYLGRLQGINVAANLLGVDAGIIGAASLVFSALLQERASARYIGGDVHSAVW